MRNDLVVGTADVLSGRLRALAEAMPVLIAIFDRDGNKLFGNEAWDVAFPSDQLAPNARTRYEVLKMLLDRALDSSEVVRSTLMGSDSREWSLDLRRYEEQDGSLAVGLTGYDITDAKRSQRLVLQSQERLKTALEAGFDAFLALEAIRNDEGDIYDFRVVDLNANAERLLRRRRWEVKDHHFTDVVGSIWGSDQIAKFARVIETRLPFEEEFAAADTAEVCWFRQQVVPLTDGVAITARDVTENRRAQQAMREHTRVLENALDGIATIDLSERIDYANSTFCSMMGRTVEQLLGMHWIEIAQEEFRPLLSSWQHELDREERFETEVRGHRLDGMPLFVRIVMMPRYGEGDCIGHYIFAMDVTERRAYEAQLQLQMQQLKEARTELELKKEELEAVNARLQDLATTDGLTGLRNHRYFRERLAEEVSRAERYGSSLTVLMIDVDYFKQYNDTFGHPAGDDVLRELAKILTEQVRTTDLVARYGGEEFAIVMPGNGQDENYIFAERLRRAVEAHSWPLRPITISIGGTHFVKGLSRPDQLVQLADTALYEAKRAGRNRFHMSAEASV